MSNKPKLNEAEKALKYLTLNQNGPIRRPLRETIRIQLECLKSNTPLLDNCSVFSVPDLQSHPNNILENWDNQQKRKRQFNMYAKFGRKMFSYNPFSSLSSYKFYTNIGKTLSSTHQPSSTSSSNINLFSIEIEKVLNPKILKIESIDLDSNNNSDQNFVHYDNLIEFKEGMSWEEVVLNSPFPVVIDCYANWCGPCKRLMPILEEKYNEMKMFRLVKVNIDENQDLADQLSITSIPAVFLIYKKNVVDQFLGLPNTQKLNDFFNGIKLLCGMGKNEELFIKLLQKSDEMMGKRQYSEAENILTEAYSHEKFRGEYSYLIKLGLAICCYNTKDYSRAKGFIVDIQDFHKNDLQKNSFISKKVSALGLIFSLPNEIRDLYDKEGGNSKIIQNLRDKIEIDQNDLKIRFDLVCLLILTENYNEAVKQLLEIIKIDKNWEDKKSNKMLVGLFNMLGSDNSIVIDGRKELARILY